jgi:hypothetical protein
MKKVKAIIVLMLLIPAAWAQVLSVDFAKTYDMYLAKELSLDFTVTTYKDKDDSKGAVESGVIRKSGDNYYSRFSGNEMVYAREGVLVIKHDSKNIIFYQGRSEKFPARGSGMQIDTTLFETADSIVYKGTAAGLKHYCLYDFSSPVYQTDLYIDAASSLVSSIEYVCKDSHSEEEYEWKRMIIKYKLDSFDKPVDKSLFSLSRYIVMKNGIYSPVEKYTTYKVKNIKSKL